MSRRATREIVRCAERADLKRCQRAGDPSAQVAGGNLIGKAAFAQIEFAADSPLEGTGFEPSVPLYGQLGTSGACDATHAAIVKLETSDRSRRRARRAICGTPGAPSARFPRDSGALDAKFDRRLASDTRIVFPPHVIWITLLSQPGTYIQGQ